MTSAATATKARRVPAVDPFAILPAVWDDEDITGAPDAPGPVVEVVTVDTAAAELGVKVATVRGYLRRGNLVRQGDGVTVASIAAYAASRAANIARTRFRPAPKPAAPAVTAPTFFTEAEMPALEVIEAMADLFAVSAEQTRQGDRGKRKARKVLDRIPAGTFGRATIEWEPSSRETPDLERIAALLKRLGINEIPMRPCADTLKVAIAPALTVAA